MNPALRRIANKVRGKLSAYHDQGIIVFHEVGKLVQSIIGDKAKYGTGALGKLAASLPERSEPLLIAARNFSRVYTPKEIKQLTEAAESNGHLFSQSHFITLSQYSGKRQARLRHSMEAKIVEEGMSTRELQQELRVLESSGPAPQGRKPAAPKTPMAAFQQMSKVRRDIDSRVGLWHDFGIKPVTQLKTGEIDENLIQQIEQTRNDMVGVAESAGQMIKSCEQALKHCEKVIQGGDGAAADRPPSAKKPTKKKSAKPARAASAKAAKAASVHRKKKSDRQKPTRKKSARPVRA
jgi:hypothetical protein